MTPHVLPHDDGEHFWWFHTCWQYVSAEGSREPADRETVLPLGPDGWAYDAAADTVSPSILCRRCGTHGFWENGNWRAA